MADKDLAAMLARIGPLVDRWYFCDLPTPRAASAEQLRGMLPARAAAPAVQPALATCHADPRSALQAAVSAADPADRIIVFGSFFTVGGVLRDGLPRLAGQHLAS
jgi:dihydrofolate synthase/folylpolyglutamate synthase